MAVIGHTEFFQSVKDLKIADEDQFLSYVSSLFKPIARGRFG